MRVVALNMNHKASERAIKLQFVDAIKKLQPDLLTLNEYVHGSTRDPLVDALSHIGLPHTLVSRQVTDKDNRLNNQVLFASWYPLEAGGLLGPTTEDGGGESNFLHIRIPAVELEVVGVRAPAYTSTAVLRDYWQALATTVRSTRDRPILFVGDFNADPDVPNRVGGQHLAALRADGWQIPVAEGRWSFKSGSRIDHTIASPSVTVSASRYVTQIEEILFASQDSESAISDHAALVFEVRAAKSAG